MFTSFSPLFQYMTDINLTMPPENALDKMEESIPEVAI